jgi:hypothetical protein
MLIDFEEAKLRIESKIKVVAYDTCGSGTGFLKRKLD